ncbi:HNH endonuclease signature motif containing protein [Nakamurella multipartita]|jgi:hypothetical protein|uniref:HNH endonuclease n=1 Tax=Nakamurella multipartita (strain ATCC 700099 / DSM 44233 / CIP 104796 / JCM 9543 / NBRC 105858 / Y-104) TaxID=479431 RepID=C8X850_NAKMY|nr:HNH endonuclease signature motif containing protein [Nakamurella multipartita]ACV77026.1 HNH endonuclease [Nakamurella multipartita DSM 44233]
MTTAVTTIDDVQHVAEQVAAGLDQLLHAEYWKLPGGDLLNAARSVEHLARLTYAVQVAVAGEIDLAHLAQTHGQPSTAALLRHALSIGPGDARSRVRAAQAVLPQDAISGGEIPPRLPALGAALRSGVLGAEQVSIVVKTMSRIPTDIAPDILEQAETTLVGHAHDMDPTDLSRVAGKLIDTLDPDGDFEPRDPADRAELALGSRDARTGLTGIKGRLDDLTVAAFIAATDAYARPRPETDGVKDQRSAGTRLAHALGTVLDGYLAIGDGPTQTGERPHVTMTIQYDALTEQLGQATLDATGVTVGPAQARRLLCDCDVIPAVLGSPSEPLDIGRATRIWPAGIRRAITLRDKACVFPGCDRPARWSDLHHIQFWVDGGPTSVANGAVLCGFHHTLIHQGDWTVRMAKDGHPEVIPPTWIDPDQCPRRNTRL